MVNFYKMSLKCQKSKQLPSTTRIISSAPAAGGSIMSYTDIEFVSPEYLEIKNEEIEFDNDREDNTSPGSIVETRIMACSTKCGEIFTTDNSYFTLVCSFCENTYENIIDFGEHLRDGHQHPVESQDNSWEGQNMAEIDEEEEAPNDNAFDDTRTETSGDEGIVCRRCNKMFTSNFALTQHKCKLPPTDLITSCKSEEAPNKDRNVGKESNVGNFSCEYCFKEYRQQKNFLRHSCKEKLEQNKRNNTKGEIKSETTTLTEIVYLEANECHSLDGKDESEHRETIKNSDNESDSSNDKPKPRASRKKLRYSVNKKMTNPELYCEICERQFKYKNIFKNHGMQHKVPPAALRNDPDYLKCRFCLKKLPSSTEWLKHEKSHTEPMPYHCTYCPKSFKSRMEVDMHTNSHTGNRPFKCDRCEASFAHSNNLATHVKRVHLRLTPFSCSVCDKKFLRNVELRIHMRQHTGERPYQCEECGRSFMIAVQLNEHLKRHTNVRDVQCPECPMAFFTKKMLRKHMVKHSDERPHVCNVCGRTFSRKKALCVHYKIHQDVKEYVCTICGKAFAQPAGLYSHRKSHMNATAPSF